MQRVLSGMRPTGRLHLGHYFGAMRTWLRLQETHECFFMVADYHALTTADAPEEVGRFTVEMVLDWLALGLDPERAVIFRQSDVPAHAELYVLLSMYTPLSWLERNPTYKDMAQEYPDHLDLGLLGYPVLQTADIVLYGAHVVPVGADQVPHLELAREIIRRVNRVFGASLREPQALMGEQVRLPGLDGQAKMSKHLDNTILLTDEPEEIGRRLRRVVTDTGAEAGRTAKSPTVQVLFDLLELFSPTEVRAQFASDYANGAIRYAALKERLTQDIAMHFEPFRKRRGQLAAEHGRVEELLRQGRERASEVANATLASVKERIGLRL